MANEEQYIQQAVPLIRENAAQPPNLLEAFQGGMQAYEHQSDRVQKYRQLQLQEQQIKAQIEDKFQDNITRILESASKAQDPKTKRILYGEFVNVYERARGPLDPSVKEMIFKAPEADRAITDIFLKYPNWKTDFNQELAIKAELGDISGGLRGGSELFDKLTSRIQKEDLEKLKTESSLFRSKALSDDKLYTQMMFSLKDDPETAIQVTRIRDGKFTGTPEDQERILNKGLTAVQAERGIKTDIQKSRLQLEREKLEEYRKLSPLKRRHLEVMIENTGFDNQISKLKSEKSLREEFTKSSKDFNRINVSYNSIDQALRDPNGARDVAAIKLFQKFLDDSVIYPSEFGQTNAVGGLLEQGKAFFEKVKDGERLTPLQRQQMLTVGKDLLNELGAIRNAHRQIILETGQKYGLSQNLLIVPGTRKEAEKITGKPTAKEAKAGVSPDQAQEKNRLKEEIKKRYKAKTGKDADDATLDGLYNRVIMKRTMKPGAQ